MNHESPKRFAIKCSTLLIVLQLLVVAGCFFWFSSKKSAYVDGLKDRQAELQELQAKSETLESADLNTDVDAIQVSLSSAKEAGEQVAANQNQLFELLYTKRTSKEEESAVYEQMNEIKSQSVSYFGEGSDFCTPWFYGDQVDTDVVKWSFQTNYDYTGDVIPVLWVLAETKPNSSVIAYVTADYHASTDSFDHAMKHVTRIGNTMFGSTNENDVVVEDVDVQKSVDSILDLTNIDRNVTPEQHQKEEDFLNNQEEFREIQAQAREQMMAEQYNQ